MNEFNEIIKLMNNGLDNDSTLSVTAPKIIQFALRKNAPVVGDVMNSVLPEAALNRPHPGLDEVMTACQNVIDTYTMSNTMNIVDVEKEVVANKNYS